MATLAEHAGHREVPRLAHRRANGARAVDPLDVVRVTARLVDVDTTTGRESALAGWLTDWLGGLGWSVSEQVVSGDRRNILATLDPPRVVLSTHYDCVPPFFPSRIDGDRLYGRGSCDAKGILAAQVAAAERLRAAGERRIGLLFLVGEERGSDGAMAANALANGCAFLVNGEPTDNRLAAATRGMLRVRLDARGRAAHSSHPELGESAIEKLVDVLMRLRAAEWPQDATLGTTHYTVGLISGGIAPNVVPPSAEAEIVFRTVVSNDVVREELRALAGGDVTVHDVLDLPLVRTVTVPGFETAVFPYSTDIPFLARWGQPLLYGPGSILVAHTANEHVRIPELDRAVDGYQHIAASLLGRLAG
ncbi:MAG: M20/M25/M40 family metallo-hydrolase [Luteitalea sp.]|nr:M20/M25/M40 family metallo-hydrolase [Luteitalea sp.]